MFKKEKLLAATLSLLVLVSFGWSHGAGKIAGQSLGALSVFLPVQGGTGTSTKPSYGQVLVGNNVQGYDLVATSSLGIVSGGGGGNSKWATSTNGTDIQPNVGQGLNVNASSTFTGNLFSKGAFYASSTSLFTNGLTAYASTTLQNFTAVNSTSTQATTTALAVTGNATTTFTGGMNISTGCYAIGNTCISAGGGSVTGSGILNTIATWTNGTTLTATSGIPLYVGGIFATSTTQPSTFAGPLQASTTALFTSGISAYASSTFQNLTFVNATGTQATTTNFQSVTAKFTNFILNNSAFTSLLGTGLTNSAGVLTNSGVISGSCTSPISCSGTNPLAISLLTVPIASGGTNNTVLQRSLLWYDSTAGTVSATGTQVTIGNLVATNTAMSLFNGPVGASSTALFTSNVVHYASTTLQNFTAVNATTSQATTTYFAVTGNATTTFTSGISLTTGCFAIGTTCIGGGGSGSGTVSSGLTSQVAYYAADGTTVSGSPIIGYASSTNRVTLFGVGAGGQNATTSTTNTLSAAFGWNALNAQTTGVNSSAFGYLSLANTATANNNSAFGRSALQNATAADNSAFGVNALSGASNTGTRNVGFGLQAFNGLTSGSRNIGIGSLVAQTASFTGSDNIILGSGVNPISASVNQSLNIGNVLYASGLYSNAGASVSSFVPVPGSRVGIATTTPFGRFSIAGDSLGSDNLLIVATSTAAATTTAIVVDSNGKLGIGTSSPSAELSVRGRLLVASNATSTFMANGIDLTGGCFSIANTCVGGGSGGSGNVVGPSSATDESIVRFDGTTGKLIQGSPVITLDDSGNLATSEEIDSAIYKLYTPTTNATQGNSIDTKVFFEINSLAPLPGNSAAGVYLAPTTMLSSNDVGNSTSIALLRLDGGAVSTDTGTITNTATAYISGALTGTVTGGNYAVFVGAGDSRFDGKIGIATTTPRASLSVAGTASQTNPLFLISTSTASATSTAFIVDSNGNLGIGTNKYPAGALDVTGKVFARKLTTATNKNSVCIDSSTLEIVNAGNTTCATSSKKTKHDIRDLSSKEALMEVLQLNPVSFTYNDGGDRRVGFIAEEVDQVDPRLVEYAKENLTYDKASGVIEKGDPVSVQYGNITALLVKTVQEQQKKLDHLDPNGRLDEGGWQKLLIVLGVLYAIWNEIDKRKNYIRKLN